jgi:hypothetical protein
VNHWNTGGAKLIGTRRVRAERADVRIEARAVQSERGFDQLALAAAGFELARQ